MNLSNLVSLFVSNSFNLLINVKKKYKKENKRYFELQQKWDNNILTPCERKELQDLYNDYKSKIPSLFLDTKMNINDAKKLKKDS